MQASDQSHRIVSLEVQDGFIGPLSPRRMLSGCSDRWLKPHRSKCGGREQGAGVRSARDAA